MSALRKRYGTDFENWWKSEFGYDFDRLTESEARYLAKIRGEDAQSIRNRILEARQGRVDSVGNAGVQQDAATPDAGRTGSDRLAVLNKDV